MSPFQSRRAFTLLEVTLATAISATVAGVCLGLFLFFDRADARLQDRFIQNDQLSRLYLVNQRAFSKLLIADKPTVLKEAEQKVRAGTDGGATSGVGGATARGASSDSGDPATTPDELARRGTSRDRRIDLKNNPVLASIRAQIPPRFELSLRPDARIESPTDREATPDSPALRAERFTNVPQRLELVLTESPVPSASVLDDPEALMARVEKQRSREKRVLRQMKAAGDTANGAARDGSNADSTGAADDQNADDLDLESPIRALRGAFELRPMMPKNKNSSAEVKGWEVWWVPLAAQAGPDEVQDLEPPKLDEPFLVASDIAFIEWKAFQGRERRTEYAARLNDDIPAYVEVEVETVGGIRANWLFELGWTFGHESRAIKPPATLVAGAAQPGGTPGTPTPGNPEGAAAGTPAGGTPISTPMTAIKPATPVSSTPVTTPGVKQPYIQTGGPQQLKPNAPQERAAKKGKKGT